MKQKKKRSLSTKLSLWTVLFAGLIFIAAMGGGGNDVELGGVLGIAGFKGHVPRAAGEVETILVA